MQVLDTGREQQPDELRRQIDELGPWFHNLHLPGGVQTVPDHFIGGDFPRFKWLEVQSSVPADLAGWRVLDVGCGTATLLAMLSRDPRAERLVGLDYSPSMIRQAAQKRERLESREKLGLVVGDAERLPFVDAVFDVVTCCNSFHHYPHQQVAISEFRRVLRPGGMLILIDGFRDNVVGWVVFDVAVTLVERDVHHAAWSEVRRMAEQAGFERIRQEKMNVLAPLLVTTALVAGA
jgi:SAM-dependent methyltransferase